MKHLPAAAAAAAAAAQPALAQGSAGPEPHDAASKGGNQRVAHEQGGRGVEGKAARSHAAARPAAAAGRPAATCRAIQ